MDVNKIAQVYKDVRDSVVLEMINEETINTIRKELEARLPEYKIKCDYENNPQDVIDGGQVIAKVYDQQKYSHTYNYINLTF